MLLGGESSGVFTYMGCEHTTPFAESMLRTSEKNDFKHCGLILSPAPCWRGEIPAAACCEHKALGEVLGLHRLGILTV